MAQYKQTKDEMNTDMLGSEQGNQDVVHIATYKQSDDELSAEEAAFAQVMSQMNIADRSSFDQQYAKLWKETSDENELLSVFMCEIDFFKAYHDNYGQQGASFMLLVVGLALKNTCEQYGCFLAHYQKAEFGILMKGGDESKALEVADILCQAVEKSRSEHKFSSVSRFVTLSIGVSSIYPNSMQVLMRKVNGALHEAQILGRNQVCADVPQGNQGRVAKDVVAPKQQTQQKVVVEEVEESHFAQFMLDMEIGGRKAFDNNSVRLWQESREEQELLSMLICEVDFFQSYRDNCGISASEDILLITACALQQTCEKFGGFVYHFGGDKFIVLLKGGNATNALRVAEFIHTFIEESSTENAYSDVSDFLTVSVGLASQFPSGRNSIKGLLNEANDALFEAINAGRNQTCVH